MPERACRSFRAASVDDTGSSRSRYVPLIMPGRVNGADRRKCYVCHGSLIACARLRSFRKRGSFDVVPSVMRHAARRQNAASLPTITSHHHPMTRRSSCSAPSQERCRRSRASSRLTSLFASPSKRRMGGKRTWSRHSIDAILLLSTGFSAVARNRRTSEPPLTFGEASARCI